MGTDSGFLDDGGKIEEELIIAPSAQELGARRCLPGAPIGTETAGRPLMFAANSDEKNSSLLAR